MSSIKTIKSRRVWDSRGNPTVEVDVILDSGEMGRAIAPAGASRGMREAIDLRDGGDHLRGMDVSKALDNVNRIIAPALIGQNVEDQEAVDNIILSLDDSKLKSTLGGNATVATSLAVLHAAAAAAKKPLWRHIADHYDCTPSIPLPEIQIFGGGAHASGRVDIQDFMIMVPGADSFDEVMEVTSAVYFAAGEIMESRGKLAGIADEGGWWPLFDSNEEALETLVQAIEKAGEKPGDRVVISLDIAASEFGTNDNYRLALDEHQMNSEELIDMLGGWIDKYPIASIEDPVGEDDTEAMQEFTRRFGDHVQIIGDDYLVTNADLVEQAVKDKACNSVLVKVNQAGTVSESIQTFRAAQKAGWGAVVSARSGETEDITISHLAIGLGSEQLKVGSFNRSDRMAKWNECLRIQDELGADTFVGGRPMQSTWWGRS
ncbi:phosphopyruvate hydratase [Cocleimonas sp. KMM 6892]|uniref:phosphopyruvate hydratase n=1 Tax=unclassified Cocleimonas TaxID=2639732 RepID=UPI002DBDEBD2|nr:MULTISPECIES: phosphopyruvate hydratase [unclassified Cocleimonas]MEB8432623.1 phosphopyruvate hydratase [Cocleimonas sp. KMM 6892]MEC4715482.1 phosphopyruvate hydratase [Cocleimonas sp. KMM 6895]MEC4744900.1 phosphopyruvate hydratase [Cocleimonas sp. KMM 6896]